MSAPQVNPLTKSDPRYFIWAIVFLIVSGVSLVSYIMITGIYQDTQVSDSLWLTNPNKNRTK